VVVGTINAGRIGEYDPPMRRWALTAAIGLTSALALLAGCGDDGSGGGGGGQVAAEKAADAEILNVAISQELTLIEAFDRGLPLLRRAESRELFRHFIAQEREHVDGWTKAMRGLGGEVDAEPEEVDLTEVRSERDYLLFAYDLIGLQLTHFLDDVTHLQMRAPQSFAAAIAASQAQHLVVLRRLLGADLVESVPEAFDTGEVPPPVADSPAGKE
jgi:rubrerythrin